MSQKKGVEGRWAIPTRNSEFAREKNCMLGNCRGGGVTRRNADSSKSPPPVLCRGGKKGSRRKKMRVMLKPSASREKRLTCRQERRPAETKTNVGGRTNHLAGTKLLMADHKEEGALVLRTRGAVRQGRVLPACSREKVK